MIHPLGLKKHIKSKKDFSFAKTFGIANIGLLPDSFFIDNGDVPNQGFTTFCTAYTACDISTDEDKILYSQDYNIAKTFEILGVPSTTQGADLKTAFSVPVTFGLLPRELAPVTWEKDGNEKSADYHSYPDSLDQEALKHKKPAYLFVDGPYDHFNNVRSTIWLNRENNMSVGVGTDWYSEYEQVGPDGIIPEGKTVSGGHAWSIKGWKTINGKLYLIAKTWQGVGYGDKGYCYFSQEEFNRLMDARGSVAMTLCRVNPADVKTIEISLIERLLIWLGLLSQKLFPPQQPVGEIPYYNRHE